MVLLQVTPRPPGPITRDVTRLSHHSRMRMYTTPSKRVSSQRFSRLSSERLWYLVVRQKRTRAPQLPRLHLRRRGLRGLVVEPGPLRVEPAGAHLRAPHVELGVLVLVQAGGVRERPRRRIRLGGERRRLDAVAVTCVSFWFFFSRECVSDGVFSERRTGGKTVVDGSGRGSGAVASGPVTRDGETGT